MNSILILLAAWAGTFAVSMLAAEVVWRVFGA